MRLTANFLLLALILEQAMASPIQKISIDRRFEAYDKANETDSYLVKRNILTEDLISSLNIAVSKLQEAMPTAPKIAGETSSHINPNIYHVQAPMQLPGGMEGHYAGGIGGQYAGGMTGHYAGGIGGQYAGGMTGHYAGGIGGQYAGGMTGHYAGGIGGQYAGGMTGHYAGGIGGQYAGGMTGHYAGGMGQEGFNTVRPPVLEFSGQPIKVSAIPSAQILDLYGKHLSQEAIKLGAGSVKATEAAAGSEVAGNTVQKAAETTASNNAGHFDEAELLEATSEVTDQKLKPIQEKANALGQEMTEHSKQIQNIAEGQRRADTQLQVLSNKVREGMDWKTKVALTTAFVGLGGSAIYNGIQDHALHRKIADKNSHLQEYKGQQDQMAGRLNDISLQNDVQDTKIDNLAYPYRVTPSPRYAPVGGSFG